MGLKSAADDELVAELVVSILRVCPDLLNRYFKEVTFSFLPRARPTWFNNMKLLSKVRPRRAGGRSGLVTCWPGEVLGVKNFGRASSGAGPTGPVTLPPACPGARLRGLGLSSLLWQFHLFRSNFADSEGVTSLRELGRN